MRGVVAQASRERQGRVQGSDSGQRRSGFQATSGEKLSEQGEGGYRAHGEAALQALRREGGRRAVLFVRERVHGCGDRPQRRGGCGGLPAEGRAAGIRAQHSGVASPRNDQIGNGAGSCLVPIDAEHDVTAARQVLGAGSADVPTGAGHDSHLSRHRRRSPGAGRPACRSPGASARRSCR